VPLQADTARPGEGRPGRWMEPRWTNLEFASAGRHPRPSDPVLDFPEGPALGIIFDPPRLPAGDAGGTGAVADQLGGFDVATSEVKSVDQTSGGDDRGAVLVVVKHRRSRHRRHGTTSRGHTRSGCARNACTLIFPPERT
jgi:hypothetical protein